MEKSKLRIEIFDEWDRNCYYFDTRKGILHTPFLCRGLGRRKILLGIICSLLYILPFYSPLTYLMFSI